MRQYAIEIRTKPSDDSLDPDIILIQECPMEGDDRILLALSQLPSIIAEFQEILVRNKRS